MVLVKRGNICLLYHLLWLLLLCLYILVSWAKVFLHLSHWNWFTISLFWHVFMCLFKLVSFDCLILQFGQIRHLLAWRSRIFSSTNVMTHLGHLNIGEDMSWNNESMIKLIRILQMNNRKRLFVSGRNWTCSLWKRLIDLGSIPATDKKSFSIIHL